MIGKTRSTEEITRNLRQADGGMGGLLCFRPELRALSFLLDILKSP